MEPQLTDKTDASRPPIEQSLGESLAQDKRQDLGQSWRGGHEEEHVAGEEQGRMHWGLMVLCCLPMIAVLLLVILGVWSIR